MAYKPYNTDIRAGESIEHYYTRLAKVADQRLLRLKELSGTENFKGVEKFAYAKAQKSLEVWGGERFNTKIPDSTNLRNEKIADIIHFLESPTSTKSGIVDVYKKRATTMKNKYGLDMSWQELGKVMESFSDDSTGGSATKVKALGIIKQIDKEGIEAAKKKNPNLDDDIVKAVAERYLKNDKYSNVIDNLNLSKDKSVLIKILEEI